MSNLLLRVEVSGMGVDLQDVWRDAIALSARTMCDVDVSIGGYAHVFFYSQNPADLALRLADAQYRSECERVTERDTARLEEARLRLRRPWWVVYGWAYSLYRLVKAG